MIASDSRRRIISDCVSHILGISGSVLHMTSTEARSELRTAVATRTALVTAAQEATPRARRAAWDAVDAADFAVGLATRRLEQAVRAEMPGASEAQVMAAALSA